MSLVIYVPDREFAVATGQNMNAGRWRSRIDAPPGVTRDLVISGVPGDAAPGTFAFGDCYDLEFGRSDIDIVLDEALVVRSDRLSRGIWVVVFEGVDQNGGQVQVIWTPGFDLGTWYRNRLAAGQTAEFLLSGPEDAAPFTCPQGDGALLVAVPALRRASALPAEAPPPVL